MTHEEMTTEMKNEIERRRALMVRIDRLLASEHISAELRSALEQDKAHQQRTIAAYEQC
jgi:hypothetical protein